MYKTQFVDTYFHSNERSEFHLALNSDACLPELKIFNFGWDSALAPGGGNAAPNYLAVGGAYNLIQECEVYFNDQLIDGVKNVNASLWRLSMGARPDTKKEVDEYMSGAGSVATLDDNSRVVMEENDERFTVLDLSKVIPFLGSIDHLAGAKVRVVIKYETNPANVFKGYQAVATFTVKRPVLAMRVVDDDESRQLIVKQSKNYTHSWASLEREFFAVSSGAQNVSRRLRNSEGKKLQRLWIQNQVSDTHLGPSVSYVNVATNNVEKLQIVSNGRKLLPYSGSDLPSKRAGGMQDLSDWCFDIYSVDNRTAKTTNGYLPTGSANFGTYRMNSLERIDHLELMLEGTYLSNMTVYVWSNPLKMLSVENGKISVSYL